MANTGSSGSATSSTEAPNEPDGFSSLRLDNSNIEIARPIELGVNTGTSIHRITTYVYIPTLAYDQDVEIEFTVATDSKRDNPSASFITALDSGGNLSWFLWHDNQYVDSGVDVVANIWIQIMFEMDMPNKQYYAYIGDPATNIHSQIPLEFGPGQGGGAGASSTNITGIVIGRNASSGGGSEDKPVFFDGGAFVPNVPEPPVWLAFPALLAGGVLLGFRRRP